jgi:hypothetical protein
MSCVSRNFSRNFSRNILHTTWNLHVEFVMDVPLKTCREDYKIFFFACPKVRFCHKNETLDYDNIIIRNLNDYVVTLGNTVDTLIKFEHFVVKKTPTCEHFFCQKKIRHFDTFLDTKKVQ